MTGQAAIRMLLVIVLIVTAHVMKPFSVKNFANHLLHSSRSFVDILPGSDRIGLNHATLLAFTLSNTFFSSAQNDPIPAREAALDQGVVVAARIQPAEKARTIRIKRWANRTAKRAIRVEEGNPHMLISRVTESEESDAVEDSTSALGDSEEATTVATPPVQAIDVSMPVILPNVLLDLSKVHLINFVQLQLIPYQINLLYQPRTIQCEKPDIKKIKMIAVIEKKKRISGVSEDLECDREGSRTTAGEEEAPGPQFEFTEALEMEDSPAPKQENCILEQE